MSFFMWLGRFFAFCAEIVSLIYFYSIIVCLFFNFDLNQYKLIDSNFSNGYNGIERNGAALDLLCRMSFSAEKVPNQTGFLILNEEGGIVQSGGDLEYNEHVARTIYQMVNGIDKNILSLSESEGFKKLSINYEDHFYIVVLSNKKIHVVKRNYVPLDPAPV